MEQVLFNSLINQILTNIKISTVIGKSIKVTSKGNSLVAICPFHNDHSPSLNISDQKKIFKCFACGTGGNVITFVQKFHRLNFIAALKWLNDNFKLDLPGIQQLFKSTNECKLTHLQQQIAAINKLIKNYYNYQLICEFEKDGPVSSYCRKRNLTLTVIKHFSLGYASNDSKILDYCKKNKLDFDDCVTAGILSIIENKYVPFFKNRIIFPITGLNNEIVGFSGRIVGDNPKKQKYLNVKTNVLFQKKTILFNLNNVQNDFSYKNIIVTEGFMDVIALWIAGFSNAVAAIGLNINRNQIASLYKHQQNIILAFNNDNAGKVATIKAIERCIELNYEPLVVNFNSVIKTYVNDIDDLLNHHGKKYVVNLIKKSCTTFFDYFVQFYKLEHKQANRKLSFGKKIIRILNSFPLENAMAREVYIIEWSKLTNISPSAISAYLRSVQFSNRNDAKKPNIIQSNDEINYANIITKTEQNVLVDFVRRWNVEEVYYWLHLNNQEYNIMLINTFKFLRKYLQSSDNYEQSFQWKSAEYIQLLENNVNNPKNLIDPLIINLFKNLIHKNNKNETDLTTKFWKRKNNYLVAKRRIWVESFDKEFSYLVKSVDETKVENQKCLQKIIGNKNAITAFSITKPKITIKNK